MQRQRITLNGREYICFVDGTPPKVQRIHSVRSDNHGRTQAQSLKMNGETARAVVEAWRALSVASRDPLKTAWNRSA